MTKTNQIQTINEQHLDMAQMLTQLTPVIKETKRMVRDIEQYGVTIEQPDLTATAQAIGKNVIFLRDLVVKLGALGAATNESLRAMTEARDVILGELKGITDAIERVDTNHPVLKGFADRIEEDVNDAAVWDWEGEQFAAAQHLQEYLGLPVLVANHYAGQLKELMFGEYAWTDEQALLMQQLLATFDEAPPYLNDVEFTRGGVDD